MVYGWVACTAHNGLTKEHRNGCSIRYSWGLLGPMSHMEDETIHTEGERFDIREANGKLYVYDKQEDVKQVYLVQK